MSDQGCLAPRLANKLLAPHVRHPDLDRTVAPFAHPLTVFANAFSHRHSEMLHVTIAVFYGPRLGILFASTSGFLGMGVRLFRTGSLPMAGGSPSAGR